VRSRRMAGLDVNITNRSVRRDADGDVMVLGEDGIHMITGNVDSLAPTSSGSVLRPSAQLFSRLPTDPEDNPNVRHIVWSAEYHGEQALSVAVRGARQKSQTTGSVSGTALTADTRAIIIGTTSWGASGVWYQDAPMGTLRFDADFSTPDLTLELAASGGGRRLGSRVSVEVSGSAPKRTPVRGPT